MFYSYKKTNIRNCICISWFFECFLLSFVLKYFLPFLPFFTTICLFLLTLDLTFFSTSIPAHFLFRFFTFSGPPATEILSIYIDIPISISSYLYSTLSLTSFTLAVVAQHIVGQNIGPCLTTSVISMLSVFSIAVSTTISVVLLIS